MDVLIPETGSKRGMHLKILAKINLDKPLLRGTKVKFNNKSVWVEFKYENLAFFYFYCGKVGHMEKNCEIRKNDVKTGSVVEGQYGGWLRADLNMLLPRGEGGRMA